MRIAPAFLISVILTAAPVLAQDAPPQEHLDAMVNALMDNGCVLTQDNMQPVLIASGLTGAEGNAAMRYLRETDGLPRLTESADDTDDGSVSVTVRTCSRAPGSVADMAEPRAALIAMLAAHDCSMLLEEAQPLMPEYGLEMMEVMSVVGAMEDAGEAVIDGARLTIVPEVCATAGQ
jgi:hypothetical protein